MKKIIFFIQAFRFFMGFTVIVEIILSIPVFLLAMFFMIVGGMDTGRFPFSDISMLALTALVISALYAYPVLYFKSVRWSSYALKFGEYRKAFFYLLIPFISLAVLISFFGIIYLRTKI